jgi:hypothetical protein
MISPKYLPANFVFRDPSKMKKAHYRSLLEHWYARQEDGVRSIFAFRGYWDPSSDSVMKITKERPRVHKRSKLSKGNRRTIAQKPKPTDAKAVRKANEFHKRSGPPGIRKSDTGWSDRSEDEKEDEEEDEDEDDMESGEENGSENNNSTRGRRQYGIPFKAPPMDLPFSAKLAARRGVPVAPKNLTHRLPAIAGKSVLGLKLRSKKAKVDVPANKESSGPQQLDSSVGKGSSAASIELSAAARSKRPNVSKSSGLDRAVQPQSALTKRPQPRPAYEPPVTRSGGKRKVDDAGLQAAGEPSSKRGKKEAASRGK